MIFTWRYWDTDFLKYYLPATALLFTGLSLAAQPSESTSGIFEKHHAPVRALAIHPNGKILASGSDDGTICFWDIQTGQLTGTIENQCAVKALQFADENSILAACGPDILLTDLKGTLIRTFSGYTTDIWSFSYHVQKKSIVAGSFSKFIKVWDAVSGKATLTLEGHEKSCLPVCFSPSGNIIASGSLDKSVRLWNALTGKEQLKMELHSENIFAVAFHPSGRYVASASADKSIRLWNVATGEILRTYAGHDGAVFDIRFSGDGNHMISCSADHTIILWETATGSILHTFTGHTGMVNAVRFSSDGTGIASASDDHTVRWWPLEKRHYVERLYRNEIEQAIAASDLPGPRKSGETRQDYVERQKKADDFLNDLYEEFYRRYTERLGRLSPEDPPSSR